MELRQATFGHKHIAVVQSLKDLAWNLREQGKHAEAEAKTREAWILANALDASTELRITLLRNLAFHLCDLGRDEEMDIIVNDALLIAQKLPANESPELASLLHHASTSVSRRGDHLRAERMARDAIAMHQRLRSELDPEIAWAIRALGTVLENQQNYAEAETCYRDTIAVFERIYGGSHKWLIMMYNDLTRVMKAQNKELDGMFRDQLKHASQRVEHTPRAREAWLQLARVQADLQDWEELGVSLQRARALGKLATPEASHQLAEGWSELAAILSANRKRDVGEDAYRFALELRQPLENSSLPGIRLGYANDCEALALMLPGPGQAPEAEKLVREAVRIKHDLTVDFPDDHECRRQLAHSHLALYQFRKETMPRADAEKALIDAAAQFHQLADIPDVPVQLRESIGHDLWHLGDQLSNGGKHSEAAAADQKALDVFVQLAHEVPSNRYYRQEQAFSRRKLAEVFERAGRIEDAERHLRDSLTGYQELAAEAPDFAFYRQEEAYVHWSLAGLFERSEQLSQSELPLRRALQLYQGLASDFPSEIELKLQLFRSQLHLAGILERTEKHSEALQFMSTLPERLEELLVKSPGEAVQVNNVVWAQIKHQHVSAEFARWGAILVERAANCRPVWFIWNTVGVAHYRAENWSEAIEWFEKSIEHGDGNNACDCFFLAMAHWQLGDFEQARNRYYEAVEWMEKNSSTNTELIRFRAEAKQLLDGHVATDDSPPGHSEAAVPTAPGENIDRPLIPAQ